MVVACIALWAPHARAESDDTTGAVIVSGATDRDVSIANKAAAATLNAGGWQIKDVSFTEKEAKAATACLPSELATGCAGPLLKSKHVARVAIISLTLNSATKELAIAGRLMVPGAGVVPVGQRYCDQCTDDTLAASTRELTQDLLNQLAVASGRTVLEVVTVPTDALFFVDKQPAGSTDKKLAIAPGEHVLRIEKPGYLTVERLVTGVDGSTTKVEVKLEAEDPKHPVTKTATQNGITQPPPPRVHGSRVAPAALMIIGGVAVVGGGVLLALNESEPRAAPHTEQPRYYTSTIVPGGITIAAGAVAIGVGYFWWRHASSSTVPVVAPVAGGAVVGFTKSF